MTTAAEVRERPILFSGPMVRAILAGRKTQTRRVVKPQPVFYETLPADLPLCPAKHERPGWWWHRKDGTGIHSQRDESALRETFSRALMWCPYGQPGDRLWVREAAYIAPPNFADPDPTDIADSEGRHRTVGYAASMDGESVRCATEYGVKLSPSIFMPRWASRLTLDVTGVRVERLQEISEADARAEGLGAQTGRRERSCRDGFIELWDSINAGRGFAWSTNPWVWVIEFTRVEG